MAIDAAQLKLLLIGSNVMSTDKFVAAEKDAVAKNIPLEVYLPSNGLIHDTQMGQIIANYLKVGFVDLTREIIGEDCLNYIPSNVAFGRQTIVFREDLKTLHLATSHTDDLPFIKLIGKKSSKEVKVYYATPRGIGEALKFYKSNFVGEIKKLIAELQRQVNPENIIKIADMMLEHANDNHASDIHIEPLENNVGVRYRIDGILHELFSYPKALHDQLVSRIKILGGLRIDEHSEPQDGHFEYKNAVESFDVRVSILPITHGENIVLRILSRDTQRFSLDNLGFEGQDLKKLLAASAKPYGMIIVVGPTGSGKTTTLYTLLSILNKPEVNIMTIEDPVEYNTEHIQQMQVNIQKNITFSNGLRSIIRQDPNIIMVGEIRDDETAGIAINAALTGHLVFSTLHANDTATTFPRLMNMGLEPFLIASAVNLVVSQRLVRKLCDFCKESYVISKEELEAVERDPVLKSYIQKASGKEDISQLRLYHGPGCRNCGDIGYRGRTGVFEVMEVNEALRPLIHERKTADEIRQKATELGMTTLAEAAVRKMVLGFTSFSEIIRATKI